MPTAANDLVANERNLNSLSTITLVVTLTGVSMTFGALIVVFLLRALQDQFWTHIQLPRILWLSTVILLLSSFLFEYARRRLVLGQIENFHRLIAWTTGVGVLFLASQVVAGVQVLQSVPTMTNNPHTWFIFLFAGLHALHIIAGLIGFAVLWYRTREPASGPRYQMGTRAGARALGIFWHYMDCMWIVLLALLIFWRR